MILSSIFGKTKPINFILLSAYLLLVSSVATFWGADHSGNTKGFSSYLIALFIIIISMFVCEFVCKRNNLSLNNNYVIYSFVTLTATFPVIFSYPKIALAGWFILLSIRKIITLKSQIGVKRKIFDASFWIAMAVLFYNGAVLMFIPLYVGVAIYAGNSFKNLLIPFVALTTVFILAITLLVTLDAQEQFYELFSFKIYLQFDQYNKAALWLPLALTIFLILIAIYTFIAQAKSKTTSVKNSLLLMLITLFSVLVGLIFGNKSAGAAYALIGFPLAVFTGNYLELLSKKWILEVLLWIFLMLPLLNLLL